MLRLAVARSNVCLEQGLRSGARRQWQPQRIWQPVRLQRTFADEKKPVDNATVPNTQDIHVAGVPKSPIEAAETANPSTSAGVQPIPKEPPPSTNTGNLPPTGTGTASTGPSSAPSPKPPRSRIRKFLMSLLILSSLGYAGGVYYSLVSDNFHDFFTEYVPYGEDAVGYFEEREFRKRFPGKVGSSSGNWPQISGENKTVIGRQSGASVKTAKAEKEGAGEDLGKRGKHSSAVEDNKPKAESKPSAPRKESEAKTSQKQEAKPVASEPKSSGIDHVNVAQATEPVVQDLVKLVNNIITSINASPEAAKLGSTVNSAKEELSKVIAGITTLKDKTAHDAEASIKNAHTEFDTAAKELVRRLEQEMREQELKWREEYESEREKLSSSYQQRLATELDSAQKVSDQKNKNALLEQEIALQNRFMETVKAQVESERDGRLSKLDQLSNEVADLGNLTSEWNTVVGNTQQTQHLQIALEAVRAKLQESEHPTPFVNELVALKQVSGDDDVVNAAIGSINPLAYQRGVASNAHLVDRFRRVASEVRKASLLPEDAGVASHAASAVLSRFMFQKKSDRGLPEGDDVEATLARTEVLLEEGDLDAAAREMNALKGWAGVLSRDWVGECRRVLEIRQAVDVIAAESRLRSLLVK